MNSYHKRLQYEAVVPRLRKEYIVVESMDRNDRVTSRSEQNLLALVVIWT